MFENAKFLKAQCGVRYWEDASVDGVTDDDGALIPCRVGDYWEPTIELATGKIQGWPEGVSADVHYKVCDDGRYTLTDDHGGGLSQIDGYVPAIMCPAEGGGDYVIMKIENGVIQDWRVDLAAFEGGEFY